MGYFDVLHTRGGRTLDHRIHKNIVTTAGLQANLAYFSGGVSYPNWYFGLIGSGDPDDIPTVSASDTLASKPWSEWTFYSGDRREWGSPLTVLTNNRFTSTTRLVGLRSQYVGVQFTLAGYIHGFFLATEATKGGTSGLLYCLNAFSSPYAAMAGDIMYMLYTIGLISPEATF